MRILICDYDEKYMEQLMKRIQAVSEEELVFESYTDTHGAILRIDTETFDIAFFGTKVNGRSGFELGRILKKDQPDCILFYLCDDLTDMHEVFRIGAFQLILKNSDHMLESEFQRAVKTWKENHFSVPFMTLDGERMDFIPSEIIYIETRSENPIVVTTTGRFRGNFENLTQVKRKLKKYDFLQIHPYYFINIRSVELLRAGDIQLNNGDFVPVSAMNEKLVEQTIHDFYDL